MDFALVIDGAGFLSHAYALALGITVYRFLVGQFVVCEIPSPCDRVFDVGSRTGSNMGTNMGRRDRPKARIRRLRLLQA
jgi:hypothetical protein